MKQHQETPPEGSSGTQGQCLSTKSETSVSRGQEDCQCYPRPPLQTCNIIQNNEIQRKLTTGHHPPSPKVNQRSSSSPSPELMSIFTPFLLQGQLSELTLNLVSVLPPCYRSSIHVKDSGHFSKVQVASYS